MGDIGAIIGGVLGTVFGNPAGTFGGMFEGSEIENNSKSQVVVNYPEPVDYSDALAYASENNKTTSLAQIRAQESQLQQTSVDRKTKRAADLEMGLEKLDAHLQLSKLDYFKQMSAEENRHVEKMSSHGDLPAPEVA